MCVNVEQLVWLFVVIYSCWCEMRGTVVNNAISNNVRLLLKDHRGIVVYDLQCLICILSDISSTCCNCCHTAIDKANVEYWICDKQCFATGKSH